MGDSGHEVVGGCLQRRLQGGKMGRMELIAWSMTRCDGARLAFSSYVVVLGDMSVWIRFRSEF